MTWQKKAEFDNENYALPDLNTLTSAEIQIVQKYMSEFLNEFYTEK
jgi:hypothetical protein